MSLCLSSFFSGKYAYIHIYVDYTFNSKGKKVANFIKFFSQNL